MRKYNQAEIDDPSGISAGPITTTAVEAVRKATMLAYNSGYDAGYAEALPIDPERAVEMVTEYQASVCTDGGKITTRWWGTFEGAALWVATHVNAESSKIEKVTKAFARPD